MSTIQSVTTQTGYIPVTDVGTTGTFLVTKPTGLLEGEVLLVVTSVDTGTCAPPAGWSTGTLPNDFGAFTDYFYKTASAADAAASDYTFTTSSDVAEYVYNCYRLSGTATTRDPVIQTRSGTTTDASTSGSVTFASSITIPDNTVVVLVIGKNSNTTTGSTPGLSNYALTGGSVTFTERVDVDDVGGSEDGITIADGKQTTSSTITGATFTIGTGKSPATDLYVNALFLYPKQNANENVGFYTTGNTAFAPDGRAGASLTVGFATTTNIAFAPTGRGTSPTQWTNETKPSTTWTNETL